MIHLITSFNQLQGHHAIGHTFHTTLQATSCQLVYVKDMIHSIAFRENCDSIQNRERTLSASPMRKNKEPNYKVGDQVLLETSGILWKLSTSCTGPYHITNVYKNGTIRIKRNCIRYSEYPWNHSIQ
jgi:hypothetical protein